MLVNQATFGAGQSAFGADMQSLSNESSQAQHELDLTQCEFMLSTCACLNLRKASRAVTQIFDQALLASGLRSTQLQVLVTFASSGTTTITQLAEELIMDRTSLTDCFGRSPALDS